MAIAKRIFLFVALNLVIMLTITTIMSALGVRPYLNANGIDLGQLAAFCLIWGFGGAFISLGLSRIMAKWMNQGLLGLCKPSTNKLARLACQKCQKWASITALK
jgi:hypothetical protein